MHTVFSADSQHLLMDAQDRSVVICALERNSLPGRLPRRTTPRDTLCLRLVHRLKAPVSYTPSDPKRKSLRLRPTFGGKRGAFVAMGTRDGAMRLWHWPSATYLTEECAHSGPLNCVAWSPVDPQLLVTVSDDGTVGVWGPRGAAAHEPGDGAEHVL